MFGNADHSMKPSKDESLPRPTHEKVKPKPKKKISDHRCDFCDDGGHLQSFDHCRVCGRTVLSREE